MKDLGEVAECLGMKVSRDRELGTIFLSQQHYVEDIVEKFGMTSCKSVVTPLVASQKLVNPAVVQGDQSDLYRRIIGALMYLSVCTRPDISQAVSCLSQFKNCSTKEHLNAAKHVIAYLKGTLSYGLFFKKGNSVLTGFADADFAGCLIDRKSFSGYIFLLNGAAVSWKSGKQNSVTLADSTTFAEYVAVSECGKEGIYLTNLLKDLGFPQKSVVIFNDNQGAEKLCNSVISHKRSKHIDVKYHQIRQWVTKGIFSVEYLPTERMLADFLTKALNGTKHRYCMSGVGLVNGSALCLA